MYRDGRDIRLTLQRVRPGPTEPVAAFQRSGEDFVQADPYFQHGLVRSHTIQPWSTVLGATASTPVYPAKPA